MPLPLILGIAAGVAALAGAGTGVHGAAKMKEANDTMKSAERRNEENIQRFEKQNKKTIEMMDEVGEFELSILKSFDKFVVAIEKIHNKPEFKINKLDGIELPQYDPKELGEISVGAGVLLGAVGGAALGTAGGFAAAGGTTAAVMALGTASTGTAIGSLSGIALTNATLAALGGGAIAAGGGGIALGTAVLGASTLGIGLLVGGIVFNLAGSSLSHKADEAWREMKKTETEIDKICDYLKQLDESANTFYAALEKIERVYSKHLRRLCILVEDTADWNYFTEEEKQMTQNTVLLVGFIKKMCEVKLVLGKEDKKSEKMMKDEICKEFTENKDYGLFKKRIEMLSDTGLEEEGEMNKVNKDGINQAILEAESMLNKVN
ncbi:MAG: hypothetical protein ACRCU3_07915 [Eubacteriaceae bacterium]